MLFKYFFRDVIQINAPYGRSGLNGPPVPQHVEEVPPKERENVYCRMDHEVQAYIVRGNLKNKMLAMKINVQVFERITVSNELRVIISHHSYCLCFN